MKKIILLFTLGYFLLAVPIMAQTTPTPSSTSSPERTEEIKARVEERIQEIKEKTQQRAFWGTLKQITNSTLILDTPLGERRVKTTDQTKIFLDKKQAKFTDLGIGNFLIVISSGTEEPLTAKRVSAFSKPPKPTIKRQAIFGKVSDISSDEEKILVVTHQKKPGVTYEVKVTDKTVITKKVDGPPSGEAGKIKKVNFEAIAIGDRVVCVAIKEKENNTFTAKIIHVIPGKAVGLEKLTPTPSE